MQINISPHTNNKTIRSRIFKAISYFDFSDSEHKNILEHINKFKLPSTVGIDINLYKKDSTFKFRFSKYAKKALMSLEKNGSNLHGFLEVNIEGKCSSFAFNLAYKKGWDFLENIIQEIANHN